MLDKPFGHLIDHSRRRRREPFHHIEHYTFAYGVQAGQTTHTCSCPSRPQHWPMKVTISTRTTRPSAERAPSEGWRGAICVRRFDDSLNSAIHNTLSRFATVFIDARAKGSTVGSCICYFDKVKLKLIQNLTQENQPTQQKNGLRWSARHSTNDCGLAPPRLPNTSFQKTRKKHWGKLRHKRTTIMILPQVHLRKPCYDFYFL